MSETRAKIFQELVEIPESDLAKILAYIRDYKQHLKQKNSSYQPIWEVARELTENVPDEVWQELPKDGAENNDRYLYTQHT